MSAFEISRNAARCAARSGVSGVCIVRAKKAFRSIGIARKNHASTVGWGRVG
jgi:hypothetical protein